MRFPSVTQMLSAGTCSLPQAAAWAWSGTRTGLEPSGSHRCGCVPVILPSACSQLTPPRSVKHSAGTPGASRRPTQPTGRAREMPRQVRQAPLDTRPSYFWPLMGYYSLTSHGRDFFFPLRGKRKKPSFLIQLSCTVGRGRLARLLGGGLQNSEAGKQTLPH